MVIIYDQEEDIIIVIIMLVLIPGVEEGEEDYVINGLILDHVHTGMFVDSSTYQWIWEKQTKGAKIKTKIKNRDEMMVVVSYVIS